MTRTAKFRVALDSRPALATLGQLVRTAQASGRKIAAGVRNIAGRSVPGLGAGVNLGAGFAAAQAATRSGVFDILGEQTGGLAAQLNEFFLGSEDDYARATRATRDEISSNFAYQVGAANSVSPQLRSYFEQVRDFKFTEERGRSLIEQELGRDEGVLKKILTAVGGYIADAASFIADRLNPLNWFS